MSSSEEDGLVVVEEPEIIQLVEQNNQNEDNNENPEANDANQEISENQEGEQADKQEVKIKRVRNPQPKLDAERLKGPRGLTMLKDVFEKVKFKGRGYEEEDLSVLMKSYEYWCHRLYPKFPFDDCLERMERLGSKKPVQTHLKKIRMDLLDEEEQPAQPNLDKSDTEENVEDTERSAFDELLPQTSQPTSSVAGITDDQLERIRINRERAQRLRQQMLIRNKEKAKMDFLNNSTDLNKRASNADQTEAPTALSQSSNLSDVLNQVDFTETMSTNSEVPTSRLEAMSVGSQSSVENMSVGSEPFFSEMSVVSDLPSPAHEVIRSASTENMSIGCSQASFAERKVSSQMSTSHMSFNLEGSSLCNATETNESQGANERGESLESDACGTIESSHSESQQTIESQDFPDNSASKVHEIGETINPEDFLMEVDNSQM